MPEKDAAGTSSPLPGFLRWSGPILAAGYGLGSNVHRALSTAKFAPLPTICIGNLSVGGTGKTPAAKYFARLLCSLGRKPAVLLRGYKEQAHDEGREMNAALADLKVPVLIGSDRLASARIARQSGCDVVLLDDGFQHWRMARDLDIVLVDALNPFGGERLLPDGWLRELPRSLVRAGVIVVTRSDTITENALADLVGRLRGYAPEALILKSIHKPVRCMDCRTKSSEPLDELKNMRVVAACGIGNPAGFKETLLGLGVRICDFVSFSDHHNYNSSDMDGLKRRAVELGANAIMVTEKDAGKLAVLSANLGSIRLLRLDVAFEPTSGIDELTQTLLKSLARGDRRIVKH